MFFLWIFKIQNIFFLPNTYRLKIVDAAQNTEEAWKSGMEKNDVRNEK